MTFLIAIMSFANFVFYPLVIGTIVAVIISTVSKIIPLLQHLHRHHHLHQDHLIQ